jgi:hypothetical protein
LKDETVVVKFAVEDFLRGRPAHHFVRFIHRRQQLDIGGLITIGKPVPTVVPLPDRAAFLNGRSIALPARG